MKILFFDFIEEVITVLFKIFFYLFDVEIWELGNLRVAVKGKNVFSQNKNRNENQNLFHHFVRLCQCQDLKQKKIVYNDLTLFCSFYTSVDSITVVITMITRKNYLECSLNTYTLKATNIFNLGNT